jgi:CBS-domain-containing membrane protein
MKVSDWIRQNPGMAVTVSAESTLEQVMDQLLEQPCLRDIYIISEEGYVIGHLSHKKMTHLYLSEHRPVHTRRQIMERVAHGSARELMESHFAYALPDEELDDVLHRQLDHDVEDMPVLDERGILLGVINLTMVLRSLQKGEIGNSS